jgi:hypothetical protein
VPSTVVEFKLTHYRRTYRRRRQLTCSKRTRIRDATMFIVRNACVPSMLPRSATAAPNRE